MKKIIVSICALALIISCDKNEYYKKEIIGDWVQIDRPHVEDKEFKIQYTNYFGGDLHLALLENSTLINKEGFRIFKKNKEDDKITHYLGKKSKYELKNDKLILYDLSDKKYLTFKIESLNNDTLVLLDKKDQQIFLARKSYDLKCKETFDKILISSSGCYGTCPISNITINKNGQILFEGIKYNTVNGLFKSKIDESEFEKILKSFQIANWINLKEKYEANHTDDETITVIFFKNGKAIKKIIDYGKYAPMEFRWAYQPLRYLYQSLNLTEIHPSKDVLDENTKFFLKIKKVL